MHKLDNVARILLRTDRIVVNNSDVAEDQRSCVKGYETSKLITSDTDLARGNAQRER